MSFIDGMHLFEFALRDFRNLERNSRPGSIILAHDCHPTNPEWGERGVRSGDVWKLLLALRKYRPDLSLTTIESPPTGLALIQGLMPDNDVLWARYDEIIDEFGPLRYADVLGGADFPVNPVPGAWARIRPLLPAEPYQAITLPNRAAIGARRTRIAFRRQVKTQVQRLKRRIGARAA